MDRISIDLERRIGDIDRNVFGGFVEHLGRCVHGGIFEPGSPRSGADGLRTDVLEAARRLRYSNIRYPGGNYVSAYRWRDGVGPVEERPVRYDPAWDVMEPNTFGTNEFIGFCRKLEAEPYLVVNCGDGEMREARDWVEYCNGNQPTALAKLRASHGFPEPHHVKYWGIGNEVDGPWQVGYKTPARVRTCLHGVRQGHALGGSQHQAAGIGRVLLGRRPCRAHPAAAGAGCRAHRLPLHPLVRRQPGQETCRPTSRSPSSSRIDLPSSRACRARCSCSERRWPPSPSRWTSGTSGTRPPRIPATLPSTDWRRSTTWPTRSSWPCTSTPSSAMPGRSGWRTSRNS